MAIYQTPRTFQTTSTGAVVSSSSGANFQFTFLPRILRLENLGSVSLWAKFGTTQLASTADFLITTCAPYNIVHLSLSADEVSIGAVSLAATSTTASAYNIWALG